jgi:hypothetical protein
MRFPAGHWWTDSLTTTLQVIGRDTVFGTRVQVLTAEDALAALPDTALTIPASISDDVTLGLAFKPWVRIHDVGHLGVIAVMSDGMRRLGCPS